MLDILRCGCVFFGGGLGPGFVSSPLETGLETGALKQPMKQAMKQARKQGPGIRLGAKPNTAIPNMQKCGPNLSNK